MQWDERAVLPFVHQVMALDASDRSDPWGLALKLRARRADGGYLLDVPMGADANVQARQVFFKLTHGALELPYNTKGRVEDYMLQHGMM